MTGPTTRLPYRSDRSAGPNGSGLSHAGRVRSVNEDAILTDPAGTLWAVADGMGGYGHGDVAADIVIDHLAQIPHDASGGPPLVAALESANAAVRSWAATARSGPMGATVVAALIDGAAATVAWVGDSRAYRMRTGALSRLTRDHSVVQELVEAGSLAAGDAERHPQAHVVTRAVGAEERIAVDTAAVDLAAGDLLLLCSDGLTKCVPDADVAALLGSSRTPEEACRKLVEAALERGGPDNVSVIVVRVAGAPAP